MEKYGFVYIWRDRKRNMYYIGSHWGYEDDGYVCSSNRMRDAYTRRPEDFKRRILKTVEDRSILLQTEYEYLSLIKTDELGKKYYNLTNHMNGHWTSYPEHVKTIKEKISHKTKEAMARPEVRAKLDKQYDKVRGTKQPKELVERRRQSMIQTMAEKFPVENRYTPLTEEEKFEYYSQKGKDMWANRSDEQIKEIGSKISNGLKGKKNRLGQTNTAEHRRKIGEAQKGKIHIRHRISIDGIEYASSSKATEALGLSCATINRRLKSAKYIEYYRIGIPRG